MSLLSLNMPMKFFISLYIWDDGGGGDESWATELSLVLLYTLCSSAPSRCEKLLIASFRMKQAAFINKLTPLNERENNCLWQLWKEGCRGHNRRTGGSSPASTETSDAMKSTCMSYVAYCTLTVLPSFAFIVCFNSFPIFPMANPWFILSPFVYWTLQLSEEKQVLVWFL